MREIVYKNLIGADNKKHDMRVLEIISRGDFMAKIERRCIYFVRKRIFVDDPTNLDKLKCLKENKDVWKKKHFHILRNHDVDTGEDSLLCKVAGTFYAIAGNYVFCIAFIHSFKINMETTPCR